MEVMGRHAGWIAGAAGLCDREQTGDAPHIILFPEDRLRQGEVPAQGKVAV